MMAESGVLGFIGVDMRRVGEYRIVDAVVCGGGWM